eukprot:SAG31_NODE_26803_length_436_cov_0.919881_1_plen_44_part_01
MALGKTGADETATADTITMMQVADITNKMSSISWPKSDICWAHM